MLRRLQERYISYPHYFDQQKVMEAIYRRCFVISLKLIKDELRISKLHFEKDYIDEKAHSAATLLIEKMLKGDRITQFIGLLNCYIRRVLYNRDWFEKHAVVSLESKAEIEYQREARESISYD